MTQLAWAAFFCVVSRQGMVGCVRFSIGCMLARLVSSGVLSMGISYLIARWMVFSTETSLVSTVVNNCLDMAQMGDSYRGRTGIQAGPNSPLGKVPNIKQGKSRVREQDRLKSEKDRSKALMRTSPGL